MSDQTSNPSEKIPTPINDMMEETKKDGTTGPFIGSIIIIVLIIIGGLYFWSTLINQKTQEIIQEETNEVIQNEILIQKTVEQSESEDIRTIEADLEATNFNILETAIEDIEKEL
jgi:amino acid permease